MGAKKEKPQYRADYYDLDDGRVSVNVVRTITLPASDSDEGGPVESVYGTGTFGGKDEAVAYAEATVAQARINDGDVKPSDSTEL